MSSLVMKVKRPNRTGLPKRNRMGVNPRCRSSPYHTISIPAKWRKASKHKFTKPTVKYVQRLVGVTSQPFDRFVFSRKKVQRFATNSKPARSAKAKRYFIPNGVL